MTELPLHPFVVHFPLAFALTLPFYFIFLFFKKNYQTSRFPIGLALVVQLFCLATATVSYWTGEWDRPLSTAEISLLDQHEEYAYWFTLSLLPQILFLATASFKKSLSVQNIMILLALLSSLLSFVLALQAGHLGGAITFG